MRVDRGVCRRGFVSRILTHAAAGDEDDGAQVHTRALLLAEMMREEYVRSAFECVKNS